MNWPSGVMLLKPASHGSIKAIVIQHLYSPAMWSVFQLQDLLGIDESIRKKIIYLNELMFRQYLIITGNTGCIFHWSNY